MSEPNKYDPFEAIGVKLPEVTAGVAPPEMPTPIFEPKSEPKEPEEQHPMTGRKNKHGVEFDPSKHNGARHPKTDAWMPKRKKKADFKASPPPGVGEFIPFEQPKVEQPEEPKPKPAAFKQIGAVCAGLWYQSNAVIHGDSAKPNSAEEHKMICESFQEVADYYGDIGEIHPVFGLALVLGGYEFARFAAPVDAKSAAAKRRDAVWATIKHKIGGGFNWVFTAFSRKKKDTESEGEKSE